MKAYPALEEGPETTGYVYVSVTAGVACGYKHKPPTLETQHRTPQTTKAAVHWRTYEGKTSGTCTTRTCVVPFFFPRNTVTGKKNEGTAETFEKIVVRLDRKRNKQQKQIKEGEK